MFGVAELSACRYQSVPLGSVKYLGLRARIELKTLGVYVEALGTRYGTLWAPRAKLQHFNISKPRACLQVQMYPNPDSNVSNAPKSQPHAHST